jgi:hypothetical protein
MSRLYGTRSDALDVAPEELRGRSEVLDLDPSCEVTLKEEYEEPAFYTNIYP